MNCCKSISENDINFMVFQMSVAIDGLQFLKQKIQEANISVNNFLKQVNNILDNLNTVFKEYEDYIVDEQ